MLLLVFFCILYSFNIALSNHDILKFLFLLISKKANYDEVFMIEVVVFRKELFLNTKWVFFSSESRFYTNRPISDILIYISTPQNQDITPPINGLLSV